MYSGNSYAVFGTVSVVWVGVIKQFDKFYHFYFYGLIVLTIFLDDWSLKTIFKTCGRNLFGSSENLLAFKKEFYYSKDFPREKHKELADTLSNIQGKFALSYYDFDDLQAFYPETKFNWHRQSVYRSSATRSGNDEDYAEKSKGTEILIMNYKNCLYNAWQQAHNLIY